MKRAAPGSWTASNEPVRDADETDLARLVRDALRHLHDPDVLQTHPLKQHVTHPTDGGLDAGKWLRRTLLEVIAGLRPATESSEPKSRRPFDLLTLRYVEGLGIDEVAAQLAISRREYNREHRQALDAVVSLLRERFVDPQFLTARPPTPGAADRTPLTDVSLPLTSFVGREPESGELVRLIRRARLITVLGPPGTGKTRLAIEVGRGIANYFPGSSARFPDGVAFVPLASIRDPGLVVSTIADRFGVREMPNRSLVDSLVATLLPWRGLLLLDNFEHVVEAAWLVSRLLGACPNLTVLVTSRAPLQISGEHQYLLPPLHVPAERDSVPFDEVARSDAIRLYVERARAVHQSFCLTEQNAPAVLEICRRLDGLPLAIELAAARVRLFPPQAFLGRLSRSLTLLTGGARDLPVRQQTLRRAIDWSFRLLSPDERRLFARLSVFPGGWTLEAVAAVGASPSEPDVVEGLASLIDQSLVQQEETSDGTARFRMLETIREYAHEQLEADRDEEWVVRCRHAAYYVRIAREAEATILEAKRTFWLRHLTAELDNIRAALAWCRDSGDIESALRLVGALQWYWYDGSHWAEGRNWVDDLLQVAPPRDRSEGRAAALAVAGGYRRGLGDFEAARALLEESLSIWRDLGHQRGIGRALVELGVIATAQGDLVRARTLAEEGLSMARAAGDRGYVGLALHGLGILAVHDNDEDTARSRISESRWVWVEAGSVGLISLASNSLGDLARARGRYAEAAAYYRESLETSAEAGTRMMRASFLHNLAHVTRRQREPERARALFTEALLLFREMGDRRGVAECVIGLAGLMAEEDPDHALRLFGSAVAAIEALGSHPNPSNRADYDDILDALRARLADVAYASAWSAGRLVTLEQAVAEILWERPSSP